MLDALVHLGRCDLHVASHTIGICHSSANLMHARCISYCSLLMQGWHVCSPCLLVANHALHGVDKTLEMVRHMIHVWQRLFTPAVKCIQCSRGHDKQQSRISERKRVCKWAAKTRRPTLRTARVRAKKHDKSSSSHDRAWSVLVIQRLARTPRTMPHPLPSLSTPHPSYQDKKICGDNHADDISVISGSLCAGFSFLDDPTLVVHHTWTATWNVSSCDKYPADHVIVKRGRGGMPSSNGGTTR